MTYNVFSGTLNPTHSRGKKKKERKKKNKPQHENIYGLPIP